MQPLVGRWVRTDASYVIEIQNARDDGTLDAAYYNPRQLERRSIHRGVFTSVAELRKEIKRYIQAHNADSAKPFVWTKSAEAILAAVDRARSSQCNAN